MFHSIPWFHVRVIELSDFVFRLPQSFHSQNNVSIDMQHINVIKLFILLNWLCSLSVGLDNGKIRYNKFCYEDESCGPNSIDWKDLCKTGTKQSPINLPQVAPRHARRVELTFNEYYCSDEFWIVDNGHTIRVTLEPEQTSLGKMNGYEFHYPFTFAEIHFHWGHDDSTGSEHAINGEFYAMEAHLVHYDSKYGNFTAAVESDNPKALAVIGVFIAPGNEWDHNEGFETIATNIPKFNENATHIRESIDLTTFLPENGQHFYRYYGSLTTPDCNEVVEWTVLKNPIYVKPSLIQKFRNVKRTTERRIGENFRPIQERGQRIVKYLAKN